MDKPFMSRLLGQVTAGQRSVLCELKGHLEMVTQENASGLHTSLQGESHL